MCAGTPRIQFRRFAALSPVDLKDTTPNPPVDLLQTNIRNIQSNQINHHILICCPTKPQAGVSRDSASCKADIKKTTTAGWADNANEKWHCVCHVEELHYMIVLLPPDGNNDDHNDDGDDTHEERDGRWTVGKLILP